MTVFLARWYILLPQHFGLSALIPPSSAPATKTKKSSNSKLTTMNQSRDYLGFVNLESPNSKTYRWIIMVFQDLLETGKSQIYYIFCLSESLSSEYSGIVNLSSLIRNVLPQKIVPRIYLYFIWHVRIYKRLNLCHVSVSPSGGYSELLIWNVQIQKIIDEF